MAGLSDLLGTFMQTAMTPSGQGRVGNALNELQSKLGGTGQGQAGVGGILGSVLDAAKSTLGNAANNPMQAAGIGAVLGSLLGGGSRSLSGAVKGGALAVLAGIAYQALSNTSSQAQQPDAPLPVTGDSVPPGLKAPETPTEAQSMESTAALVIRGMIEIAKSDGQVSADEIERIVGQLKTAGMGGDVEAWILDQLRRPLDLDAFTAEIPSKEVAAQVYAASLIAVEVDTPAERQYLADFAAKTGLDSAVVAQIHRTVGLPA